VVFIAGAQSQVESDMKAIFLLLAQVLRYTFLRFSSSQGFVLNAK